jgi:putative transposase
MEAVDERSDGETEQHSVLSDPISSVQDFPTLDDIMPDPLEANQKVFIDGNVVEFLYKHEHGPHEYFNAKARKQFSLHTAEIVELKNDGSYVVPGGGSPSAPQVSRELADAERRYLQMSIGSVPKKPRSRAEVRFLYVGTFLNKILGAEAEGGSFAKNKDNAKLVVAEVDEAIAKQNAEESDPAEHIVIPKRRQPRTVLAWLKRECETRLGPVGQVHKNALLEHDRKLPQDVFDTIAEVIRAAVELSGKFTPRKIFNLTAGIIKEKNDLTKAQDLATGAKTPLLPTPSETTVAGEFARYKPWFRYARLHGLNAADLEFGAVGKQPRPTRINTLWEIDFHEFDVHTTLGAAPWSESSIPRILSRAGIDRFWICMAIDVASGYPVGFCLTFDPGSLGPALECVEHAIEIKTYIAERWPDMKGILIGHGKPTRIRFDNGKAFVRVAMGAALARVGIGFLHAPRRRPDKKPWIESAFGTLETDFIAWLPGATGSNPKKRGDSNPLAEARIDAEEFQRLFHEYLIECFARRPQEDLGYRTAEQVYLAGLQGTNSRPRPLTAAEKAQSDAITSIGFSAPITREGINWKGLHYQSPELQALRLARGVRLDGRSSTKFEARIPTKHLGVIHVAPKRIPGQTGDLKEIEVPCTNPLAKYINHWQYACLRAEVKAIGGDPDNYADFQAGFLRLFRSALKAAGVAAPGESPPPKARLTGGQGPRFLGVFQHGPKVHALDRVAKISERFDIFGEIAAVAASRDGSLSDESVADQIERTVSKWKSLPIVSDDQPDVGG